MRKMRTLFFFTVLFASLLVCAQSASAAEITSAKYENSKITLSGTGTTQVQIVLFGSDNSPLYMTTAAVEDDGTFSITLPEIAGLTYGSYTVKVADYDGGNVDSEVITIPAPNYPSETVYDTTEGDSGTWAQGSAKEYTFKFTGLLSRFSGLNIDGKPVDKSNYTAESGSTIITLKPEYLKTLSVGSHTLRALYTDGYAQTAFTVAEWQNPFDDLAETDWFYEDVKYASIAGLMQGTSTATFAPDADASRAMIVTILWRLENKPTMGSGKSGTFTDVPESEWYTEAVEWAAANELVNGFEDSTFRPAENISREQLAAILWRYAKYKGYDVSVGEDTNILSYTDAESISEYAVPAMQWTCDAGLMQGDAGALMPGGSANRAQVAAMLHRFCEKVK